MRGSACSRPRRRRGRRHCKWRLLIMLPTVHKARRVLSARRIVLLATISGLAAGTMLASSGMQVQLPKFSSVHAAETSRRTAGFADLVDKVKPAVVSVRVKRDAGAMTMGFDGNSPLPPDSSMERFFRRFGMPFDDNM